MKFRDAHLGLITLALAASALLVPMAGASTATVQNLQPLSAAPVPGCNVPGDIEMDTRIAVNPKNPKNIVASWFELGLFAPALGSTVVAVSHDGGATWRQVVVPGHSGCSGSDEPEAAAADPAVAFDQNGVVYVGSLNHDLGHERVVVSRSTDGGDTWGPPELVDQYEVAPDNLVNAFYSLTPGENAVVNHELWLAPDPTLPKGIYAVWSKHDARPARTRYWPAYISRRTQTSDGQGTWSPAKIFYDPPQWILPMGHMLRVDRNGGLIDAFWECDAARPANEPEEDPNILCHYPSRGQLVALASSDGGSNWSRTVIADGADACGRLPRDPETGAAVSSQPKPSIDIAPNGTAYAAWHSVRCDGGRSRLLLSRSADGGRTWSRPTPIKDDTAQAFYPTLAVGPTGVIGVTYYDLRSDRPDDGETKVDVWFAHSHDGGDSWEDEVHVAGPFDVSRAAPLLGAFVGDYHGLAALPRGFAASFLQQLPASSEPLTDIFFARLFVPREGEGARATGGGWLADRDGGKINFGVTARETAFGFEGELQLNDRAAGAKIQLSKVTALGAVGRGCGSIQAGASSLELRGSGSYNGAAASFRLCLEDGGEPGKGEDLFYLTCAAGCVYDTGARTPDDAIDGGNVQVGQGAGESDEPRPATVILDPLLQSEASVGEALAFTVRVYDQHQEPLANTSVVLRARTSDGSVETLGGLTGASGTATIVAGSLAAGAEYQASASGVDSNAIALRPPLP